MSSLFIDSHCHLHKPWFDYDLDPVIKRAEDNGVTKIVNCSSDPDSFDQVLKSTKYENVYATLGMQPTQAKDYTSAKKLREIEDLDKKVVAIGEIGLDYYWVKEDVLKKKQEELFIDCINLATELDLPLVIHTRKAETESLDILEKYAETPVLLHSFDGNLKEVNRAKDLGYLISVPTIVTRRRNRRKVTKRAGLENIMIETDSPFCATREEIERNEPYYIPEAAEYMAELLETDIEEVASKTTKNAELFYQI